MSLEFIQLLSLFRQYGYFIIFTGTFFEGETTLVLGGLLAHQAHLNFWKVVGLAVLASYIGHVVFYFIGKTASTWLLERFPRYRKKIEQAETLIRRYETASLFLSQYLLGLRLASALAFGILDMKMLKFLSLQLLSCLLWALLFAGLGYWVGESCMAVVKNIELAMLIILLIGFFLAVFGHKFFDYWLNRRML